MIERILEVLKAKNFSPSQFADEIGVQRSNISHLVSGRNKPSLEFIQKIIKRFPDINPEYLLSGSGDLFRVGSQTELDLALPPLIIEEEVVPEPVVVEEEKVEPVKPIKRKVTVTEEKVADKPEKPEKAEKEKQDEKVEKIVYFFKDKTFREYFPGQ